MSDQQTNLNTAGMRKLRLTERSTKLLISQCSTMILFNNVHGNQIKASPYCKFCKNISEDNIYISTNGSIRYLICRYCFAISQENFELLNDLTESEVCELIHKSIKYSCIWNCGSFHLLSAIHEHEKDCIKMPLRKCPQCYFTARFTSLKEHFNNVHCGKLYFDEITFHERNYAGYAGSNNLEISETEFYVWLPNHNIIKCKVFKRSNYLVEALLYDNVISENCVVTVIGYKPVNSFQYVSQGTFDFERYKFPSRLHFVVNNY